MYICMYVCVCVFVCACVLVLHYKGQAVLLDSEVLHEPGNVRARHRHLWAGAGEGGNMCVLWRVHDAGADCGECACLRHRRRGLGRIRDLDSHVGVCLTCLLSPSLLEANACTAKVCGVCICGLLANFFWIVRFDLLHTFQ